jgi:hypothetical protein
LRLLLLISILAGWTGAHAEGVDSTAWKPEWVLSLLPRVACDTLLTRTDLALSSGMQVSDALARQSGLGILGAGCHGAWDLPYTLSPGTERLTLCLAGLPVAGPAVPEAALAMLSPLALESLMRVAPDPVLDPLAGGQDGILWAKPIDLRSSAPRSAVRLTEGPTGAVTQDVVIGRQSARGSWGGGYAHSASDGRPEWVQPRYTHTEAQNLTLHLDRVFRVGPLALDASDRTGRFLLGENGKLEWKAQYVSGGWQFAPSESLGGELRLTRRNDGLHAWGGGGSAIRRTTSTDAVARARLQRRGVRLAAAAGAELVDLYFHEDDGASLDESRVGMGLAISGTVEGQRGVMHLTAGWTSPWWGEGHARVHLVGAMPIGGALSAELEGWNATTAPFVPRAEGDGNALLEEGVIVPGALEVQDGPWRRVAHGETRLRAGGGDRRGSLGLFVHRMQDGIGTDPDLAAALRPDRRDTIGVVALLGSATLAGVRVGCRIGLPYGARIEGDARVLLAPARDRLPLLTAREEGRAVLAIGRGFFRNDLRLEGRLIAQGRGRWSTPYGESPGYVRWDAEIHGAKGAASFFFALRHLTDETQDSNTYADGAWMPLPYRSSQIGVEWHFTN